MVGPTGNCVPYQTLLRFDPIKPHPVLRSVALPDAALRGRRSQDSRGRKSVHDGAGVAPDWPLHPDPALQGPLLAPAGTPDGRSGPGSLRGGCQQLARSPGQHHAWLAETGAAKGCCRHHWCCACRAALADVTVQRGAAAASLAHVHSSLVRFPGSLCSVDCTTGSPQLDALAAVAWHGWPGSVQLDYSMLISVGADSVQCWLDGSSKTISCCSAVCAQCVRSSHASTASRGCS